MRRAQAGVPLQEKEREKKKRNCSKSLLAQTMHSILEYKSRECTGVKVRVGRTRRRRCSLPLHTLHSDRVSSGTFIALLKLLTVKDLKIEATLKKNPLGGRGIHISEFEANLVCRPSSRTAVATQEKPCLEKNKTNKGKPTKTTTKRLVTFASVNIN